MAETIEFPDPVALILGYLAEQLPTTPTGTLVPSPRPARFIVARRAGGERTSIVTDAAVVAIEAWGADPADAADLAETCRAHVHAMAGTVRDGTSIYRVDDVGAPGDLPDPLSDQPRYTFSILMTVRGEPLVSS